MKIARKKGEIVIDDGVVSFKEDARIGHGYDYRESEEIAGKTIIHAVRIFTVNNCLAVEFETEDEAKNFSRQLTRFLLE